MPRAHRLQEAGFVHHVVCRGNDRQSLFNSNQDRKQYLAFLNEARQKYPLKIYNYVLMDNHIHLLVEPMTEGALSKVMETVSRNYAKYFNYNYNRSGHVFEGRFKSFLLQVERYFYISMRCIDYDPVQAGICASPKDYEWSGHGYLAFGKKGDILLDRHPQYDQIGRNDDERRIAYRALLLSLKGQEFNFLQKRGTVLGEKNFREKFKKKR